MIDYKEGIGYNFIEVNGMAGVKILDGEFENVIYTYSNVSVSEDEEDSSGEDLPAVLSFNFDVVDFVDHTEEELQTIEFKNKIGDILMSILQRSVENTIGSESTDFEELAL